MFARKLVVTVALIALAAAAHAGYVSMLSEPTTVTLVFVALATIGLVTHRKQPAPADA